MRIGGRWAAHPAVAAVRQWPRQATRTPAFGIAAITPLVFAAAVGGAPAPLPGRTPAVRAVTPVAAVTASHRDLRANPAGPGVVAIPRAPARFHVAAATISAPPPPTVVNAPGTLGIPKTALAAYRNAELKMAAAVPGCGVSWNLLAGIGRIESGHAGGGAVDSRGTALNPIYGPALDGTLPGNEVIVQQSAGNRVTYARAMGPMQFLPGTWARYATDGDGDGIADPQNLFDSTLAAARYLCSGGLNLRDPGQVMAAILRYNNSVAYAQNVLGWAAAYATGVVPVDLPPITGPPPPIGDGFLEHPEGLGPNLPLNHTGLPYTDPFAGRTQLIDLGGQTQLVSTQPMFPWMAPPATQGPAPLTLAPGCTLICIGSQSPGPGPGPLPAGTSPQPSEVVAPPMGQPPVAGAPPVRQAPPPAGAAPVDPLGPPPGAPPADMPAGAPPVSPAAGTPNGSPAPKKPAGQPGVPSAPAPAVPNEPPPVPPA
ncbi:lytic transglycosylase domain-containing protein [Mycobacterium sp. 852002-51163_SCH5372311]|uniref:lytic transglycosylase domain-containing protein n=1 Tax=Mycobacterium sp. 852002-51163_SCH5372311 TaxID=1834097 RepID=UPI0009EE37FF|nr:lytic murein transglycosylase [Mycobacterium sp. 852002-51163_SCH5372311]